jgi:hypothetical protein
MDTEADNMYRFRVRVCLLQFYVCGEVFLVDALAPVDLGPLWSRLAKKHLVMHGSDFDLRLLYDFCQFRAKSLFDTMLAAQLLGRSRIGLASLIEDNFGVKLDKDGQKANWSRRPITQKLLDYAALDVWYLPALRDILTRELKRLGRTRLDGAAVPGADRGRRHRFRPARRERLADRPVGAPARPRAGGPARHLALAPGAGAEAGHAPVQGVLERVPGAARGGRRRGRPRGGDPLRGEPRKAARPAHRVARRRRARPGSSGTRARFRGDPAATQPHAAHPGRDRAP